MKEDFLMLNNNVVYLDNNATTFKPKCVYESIYKYYSEYNSNTHRADYNISIKASEAYELSREKVRSLINANSIEEIVFTSGATQSLNMIVDCYFKYYLKPGDEVLITKGEHASNVLPWFNLKDVNVKYIDYSKYYITLDDVIKSITPNTKVISIAHITNVMGDIRPIKEIVEYAHSKGILVVVDGAQSVPHIKTDVIDLDADFLVFCAHKMCGPSGVGVLYGKKELLEKMVPQNYGGSMSVSFNSNKDVEYRKLPHRLEGGTPNIEGVIGFGAAIDYLNNICIYNYENNILSLREYAINKMKSIKDIEIYNSNIKSHTILFNIKSIFSQDVAVYLNKKNICVRAGDHCSKLLQEDLKVSSTCRISLYFYNTKEDIDKLVFALSEPNILEKSL